MKVINKKKPSDTNEPSNERYVYWAFSATVIMFISYCILKSNDQCSVYFGRTGFVEDCSDSRALNTYVHLGFFFVLAIIFIIYGLKTKK